MEMEIVSTMGSGSLGREIDLQSFISGLRQILGDVVNENFSNSGQVTVRLEPNGPAYTFYRTGTFQIRGAQDEQQLDQAEDRLLSVLNEIEFEVEEYQFEQKTSVFMADFERPVNLEVLAVSIGLQYVEYEPEQFPGLVYRPPGFEVSLLLFSNGKVIIGGTTERDEAERASQNLEEQIDAVNA